MKSTRRTFLKIAGLSLLGLGAKPVFDAHAGGAETKVIKAKEALEARRWAMVVDMARFKANVDYGRVITACHRTHNVPHIGDPKKEVRWIGIETFEHTFPDQQHEYQNRRIKQRPFLVLCNHCDKPPCVRVCPTRATFRREDGIVAMDMHRCIGCRFCMVACPYGARSFNWKDPRPFIKEIDPNFPTRTKGVVEKCNFCEERLAQGLEPACVVASDGALIFGDLEDPDSQVRKIFGTSYTLRRKNELGTKPSVFYVI